MKNRFIYAGIFVVLIASAYYFVTHRTCHAISKQRCTLRTNMRKLWSDHVWWTRNYLISAIAGLPDLQVTTDRLLKNQVDLGQAIVPYYGKEAGNKLAGLLKEHILIAAQVVATAMANDTQKLEAANAQWHTNADDIALFLSSANPYWPKEELQTMMYEHLALTTQEAVARIKKDWAADIATFEKVFEQSMMMADDLTKGIVKQFPEKF